MNLNKLDRIILRNREEVDTLLKWRDNNKELVRNFKPTLTEGLIIFQDYQQYFKQTNDIVEYKVFFGEKEAMSLTIKKIEIGYIIVDSKHIFKEGSKQAEEGKQDVVTIHASLMAYMANYVHHVTERKEMSVKTKKGKVKSGKKQKDRVIKIGRKVYDISVPESVSKDKRPYEKQVESFPVSGHSRTYKKTGKTIWIESYTKGNKEVEVTPRIFKL